VHIPAYENHPQPAPALDLPLVLEDSLSIVAGGFGVQAVAVEADLLRIPNGASYGMPLVL
jgi:hypothetical protein